MQCSTVSSGVPHAWIWTTVSKYIPFAWTASFSGGVVQPVNINNEKNAAHMAAVYFFTDLILSNPISDPDLLYRIHAENTIKRESNMWLHYKIRCAMITKVLH